MSLHSYSKCWLHLIWGTLNRERILSSKEIRKQLSSYLFEYSASKNIYMKKNFVNSEHVHALIELPTNISIEGVMHLIKGSSSHWINANKLTNTKFSWGRGYCALSVSESGISRVVKYIESQEEHHRVKSFTDEYEAFIKAYGMKYVTE
ncbi:MAG: IS200/IS605 family transposase [Ignavibacteriales bacterium]|nr:MAG: IS200/IS605 family transposase [Ignavibacteriales bacterium]